MARRRDRLASKQWHLGSEANKLQSRHVDSLRLAAVELTPLTRKIVERTHGRIGAILIPPGESFGAFQNNGFRFAHIIQLSDESPQAAAEALAESGLNVLLTDSEVRASAIREHTRRPVVSSIDHLCRINDVVLVDRLNLIYHVAALRSNGIWRDNLDQLLKRWHVFTGRKIIAIATGDRLHSVESVKRYINRHDAEYIEVANDPELREVASFRPLLEAIQSTSRAEATFYAHTKGNSTSDSVDGSTAWRNAMYHHLLDRIESVRESLRTFAAVGTTKIVWQKGSLPPYPSHLMHGNWMFAGTFFWFRHDEIFSRNWQFIPVDRYGAESWLSGMLREDEALSIYQPWPIDQYPTPSPYLAEIHDASKSVGENRSTVSVVIPCKGRLENLKYTLPLWLKQDEQPQEIIVVDYSCPDFCGDWVRKHVPSVRVVDVRGKSGFNLAHARNVGSSGSIGQAIIFADADLVPGCDLVHRLRRKIDGEADIVIVAHGDANEPKMNGSCIVRRAAWQELCGYDESRGGYSYEDVDFYQRAERHGMTVESIVNSCWLPNTDEERIQFCGGGSIASQIVEAKQAYADVCRQVNKEGYGRAV